MPFTLNLPGLFALATLFTVVAIAYWEFEPAFRERTRLSRVLVLLAQILAERERFAEAEAPRRLGQWSWPTA